MAISWVKFNDFTEQLSKGIHNFGSHTFKLALTNSAPSAANTILSDITQIAAGNGYTTGGATMTVTCTESAGTTTVGVNAVTFTAAGGAIATFRYAVAYNDSATSPLDALIAYTDYGSGVSLADGQSITFNFNNDATDGTWFTVA